MRNKYPGKCYRCGEPVGPGDGHPEKTSAGWRVQHTACAIQYRHTDKHHTKNENNASS